MSWRLNSSRFNYKIIFMTNKDDFFLSLISSLKEIVTKAFLMFVNVGYTCDVHLIQHHVLEDWYNKLGIMAVQWWEVGDTTYSWSVPGRGIQRLGFLIGCEHMWTTPFIHSCLAYFGGGGERVVRGKVFLFSFVSKSEPKWRDTVILCNNCDDPFNIKYLNKLVHF